MSILTDKPGVAFSTDTRDRRGYPRHRPGTRAAAWFDFGPVIGETCELRDISMSGFSVLCSELQSQAFMGHGDAKPLFCVLLMGEAHFGSMVRLVMSPGVAAGYVGFRFEAVPAESERMLQGLIGWMAARERSALEGEDEDADDSRY